MIDILLIIGAIGAGLYHFKPDLFRTLTSGQSSPVPISTPTEVKPATISCESIKKLAASLDPVEDADYIAFLYINVLPLALADNEPLKAAIRAASKK